MYQPYPSGGGQVPEPQRPEPPASVLTAVKLMYAGAAVSAISLIVSLATIGSLRSTIRSRDPGYTQTQIHSAEVVVVAFAVVAGLISIGLWLWMASANKSGKNWARITSSVFFGLNTLGVLAIFNQAEPVLSRLITILVWLVALGAIIMLWRKESGVYFSAASRRP
jgi:hypothetical protein